MSPIYSLHFARINRCGEDSQKELNFFTYGNFTNVMETYLCFIQKIVLVTKGQLKEIFRDYSVAKLQET